MNRHVIPVAHALLIATALAGAAYADQTISPEHPRWYGRGSGPVGADLIEWVSQHATVSSAFRPDPAYYGRGGGPVGPDLIAKLAQVRTRAVAVDRVNVYGRGAPTAAQLAPRYSVQPPTLAAGSAPDVK